MYGSTTMGVRGQVVIPAQARKDLGLKAGDQLLVMGKFGKVLGLVKTNELQGFINKMMSHIDDPAVKTRVKQHIDTFLKNSKLKF